MMILDSLVAELSAWLREARDARRSQRNQDAAFLLHDASLLFAAMSAYDNSARQSYWGAMLYARSNSTDETLIQQARREAYQELAHFEVRYELFRYVEQATHSLQRISSTWPVADERIMLIRLVGCGRRFSSDISGPILHTKEGERLKAIMGGTSNVYRDIAANVPSEAIEKYASSMLKTVEILPALIESTRDAYVDLRRLLTRRYSLPPPPEVSGF